MKKQTIIKHDKSDIIQRSLRPSNDNEEIEMLSEIVNLDYVNAIKKALSDRNILPTDVASSIKVSKSYVSQIFNGSRMLNINFITRIRREFNISLELVDTAKYISSVTFYSFNLEQKQESQFTEDVAYIDVTDLHTVIGEFRLNQLNKINA
jgi:antitoxin component HigA of HigAB toxin-antitoxin module